MEKVVLLRRWVEFIDLGFVFHLCTWCRTSHLLRSNYDAYARAFIPALPRFVFILFYLLGTTEFITREGNIRSRKTRTTKATSIHSCFCARSCLIHEQSKNIYLFEWRWY